MKFRTLIASVAFTVLGTVIAGAADIAVKAPPPPPPVFSWTGFYIGANIGGAWASSGWTDTRLLTTSDTVSNSVFIGGGQIGANYQIGQFVIGGEWDFDWASSNNGSGNGAFIPGVGNIVVTNNTRWITTVAARFGWAIDHFLFYGKAGGGWASNNNLTISNLTTGVSFNCGTVNTFNGCGNNTGGWLLGAGFEYAFSNNWTAKFEYDYLGLGNRTFVIPTTFPIVALAGDTLSPNGRNISMVKFGVNYLFNWGAPSRY
jgi:outer membrane immunogenic protein